MPRRQFFRLFLVAQSLCLVFAILPTFQANAAEDHVYLSEIAWAGSSLSTADEWLELANPTDQTVSLSGWRLTGAGSSDKALVLPADATIPAGGAYLIANYAETDAHSSLAIRPDCVSTTVSLPNDRLLIQLWDNSGQLVDQASDGQAPPAGYSSGVKASMIRADHMADGSLAATWKTADTSQNLKTQDFGTPGFVDVQETFVPDETLTEEPTSSPNDVGASTSTNAVQTTVVATSTVTSTATAFAMATSTAVLDTTSTATEQVVQTATSTSSTTFTTVIAAAPTQHSDQLLLRLNEIVPNPEQGNEWVEILSAAPDRTIKLDGVELHDKSGRIAALSGEVSSTHPFFVYTLKSARFNNNGDSVYLIADGVVLDTLTYGESHKGYSWAVDEHSAWQESMTPTPGEANLIAMPQNDDEKPTEAVGDSVSPAVVTPSISPTKTATAVSPVTKATTATTVKAAASKMTPAGVQPPVTTSKKVTTKATTIKKTTTSKAKAIIPLDFPMLQDDSYGGLRVRLQGLVSTPPRLLTGRAIIITNPEGRGLLVKLPANRKLPEMNTQISVVGTLKFDAHELPYLSVAKNDPLVTLKTAVSSTWHEVAWFAPAVEDAWSLVATTGTVQSVSGNTIHLLVDDTEMDIKIRPGVAYKASRLKKDDTVQVNGILDITTEKPTILPRSAAEIQLLSHAPEKAQSDANPTATNAGLPGWTPFGAALGAIGAVEGVRKMRRRPKQKAE